MKILCLLLKFLVCFVEKYSNSRSKGAMSCIDLKLEMWFKLEMWCPNLVYFLHRNILLIHVFSITNFKFRFRSTSVLYQSQS